MSKLFVASADVLRLTGLMAVGLGIAWALSSLGFGITWVLGAAAIAGAGAGFIGVSQTSLSAATVRDDTRLR